VKLAGVYFSFGREVALKMLLDEDVVVESGPLFFFEDFLVQLALSCVHLFLKFNNRF